MASNSVILHEPEALLWVDDTTTCWACSRATMNAWVMDTTDTVPSASSTAKAQQSGEKQHCTGSRFSHSITVAVNRRDKRLQRLAHHTIQSTRE